ncbi:MAG: phosphoenolpyruvate synthase, partial [Candidatus Nanoarchaeia archaeon]
QQSEPFVAVRSSATAEDLPEASFAGQQATFLNVHGSNKLVQAVRACWASLFTARATYYRAKNGFDHMKVLISVVVQKMVNSDTAGVMFSVNPSTNDPGEIVIEGGWGLGEAVVSGSVNPDLYIVDKSSLTEKKVEVKKQEWGFFRNKETGDSEKLKIKEELQESRVVPPEQIHTLATLAKKIEEHYGKPQDMEFAVEDGKVFITQSRAVTTFKAPEQAQPESQERTQETNVLVKGETASPGSASGPVKVVHDVSELSKIEKGDILVTSMTTPDMVPAMQRAAAVVTDEGGMTCHAAIVSREMQIPCIVGTENATEILNENQIVTVAATQGAVYEGKVETHHEEQPAVQATGMVCPEPEPVTATQVKVITDIPEFAEKAALTKPDGVGLARLEFIIANGGKHPAQFIRENDDDGYTAMLVEALRQLVKAFEGKPVWVRTSDIRTDEYRNLAGGNQEPHETDPMIGWHGIRRCLDEPLILKAEFKAIKHLHDEGLTNVGIMVPFVIRVDELKRAKDIMREVGLEPCRDVAFGVMCETPASVWVMDQICREGISFVSFGTNDLTQLTLGIDRNNEHIAKLFDEMHPAVLGQIEKVVKTCQKYGVETSICGQAGSRPEMAEFLVKIGMDSISANPDAVHHIREIVARTEKKMILDAERRQISEHDDPSA